MNSLSLFVLALVAGLLVGFRVVLLMLLLELDLDIAVEGVGF